MSSSQRWRPAGLVAEPFSGGASVHGAVPTGRQPAELPSWPLTLAFAGFPLWWLLGVLDFIWIPTACVMAAYLLARGRIRVPRGFGIWLLFLAWVACAVIGLTGGLQLVRFGYGLANYVACTVVFVYVCNARAALTDRFVTGVLTIWWLIIVAGGYLALMFPNGVFHTPLSYVLPGGLLENEWVQKMVVRPLNQYNPDSYFQLDPRPSAPFIYTNQWGSAYSLLVPLVLAYLVQIRGTRRFWLLVLALVASFVPAILTTNRGMLIGLGIAAVYAAIRLALRRDLRGIVAFGIIGAIAAGVFQFLPTSDRLEARAGSPSLADRGWLYLQSIDAVRDSPLFGYGRTLTVPGAVDPVGTQGEFWIVLVSYGAVAALLFFAWFAFAFLSTMRWVGATGLAANTVLLVALAEFFFYGAAPHGLVVIMTAAALAMRRRLFTAPQGPPALAHPAGASSTLQGGRR